MAHTSHLERMGRELKCPICLSLLNKAASLTCNHVFCNCCIEASMKSAAYCPVCKVPFRRREIRPAPHMDNLVNIYKSMEVASGVNIFVTQISPTRASGIEDYPDGDRICELQENRKTSIGTSPPENHRRKEMKGLRKSAQIPAKPAFPAKKRVHVPQCPPSETRSEKLGNETPKTTNNEPESSYMLNDKLVFNGKGESLFTPFFWLRDDEDNEKTTQQTDGNQIFETPLDVPCFSDMKDSDDEVPSEMAPEMGTCSAAHDKDVFDSEMFEWTQRACSPELRSSPVLMQAEDGAECKGQMANRFTSPVETVIMARRANNMGTMVVASYKEDTNLPSSSSSPRNKIVNNTAGMSGKRTKKAVETRQSKRAKKGTIDTSRAPKQLESVPEENIKMIDKSGSELNVIKKASNSKKKVRIDADVTRTTWNVSSSSSGDNILNQDNSNIVVKMTVLSNHKKHEKRNDSKNNSKISRSSCPVRNCSFNSKAEKLKATKKCGALNQSEVLLPYLHRKLSCDREEVADMESTIRRCEANCSKRKTNLKMVGFAEGSKVEGKLADDSDYHNNNGKVVSKDAVNCRADKENLTRGDMDNSSGMDAIFRQFKDKFTNKIFCAFCQSAEDSEVSGVMLHYVEGKPVAGDQIEGQNVIHCHKNCAEWAPNVFFEDDHAINIEAELRRSRKIRCGLCGNRGAALGCFDRNCRKSFHVPCAKMTSQFRWDYENFVILCPLHASGELPFEAPASQSNRKRSAPIRDSNIHKPQIAKDDKKENLFWKSHRKAKDFIICCSGLTNIEKEIISEFEKLSRITLLKNWDLSVTHVVASTDDNGACRRTLKFLMGVLEGKWIVNVDWIRACINSMEFVDEEPYEIKTDIHGIKDGPNLGRLRNLQKEPKLFNGCKFYFMGEFEPSYKGYLHDLVIAAGGSVLKRKPVPNDQDIFSSNCSIVFIVYTLEQAECGTSKRSSTMQRRRSDAETLATSTGGVAVTNSWLLNTIAGCKFLNLPE